MRFLLWCVGVLVLVHALEYSRHTPWGWTWWWISAAVFWFVLGAGLALVALARALQSKMGAGGGLMRTPGTATLPAPKEKT